MLKFIKLEQKIALINNEIDKKFRSITCKYCHSMATHVLITGEYSNYEVSIICHKCSDRINKLKGYQLDLMGFVDSYKLTI